MKALIIGSNGLLGQNLQAQAPADCNLVCAGLEPESFVSDVKEYHSVDVSREKDLKALMNKTRPDWVLNAAAMTNVDGCEKEPEKCRLLNYQAVTWMAEAGLPMVHLSTDYVFDGKNGPYKETDPVGPLGVYGKVKYESEAPVLEANAASLVVRTMLLWGRGKSLRSSFGDFVRDSLRAGKTIRIVTDQWGNPTLASDLAGMIWKLVTGGRSGIYHASGGDFISRYEWACRVADFYGLNKGLIQTCTTEELGQAAKRPLRSGFILDKLKRDTGHQPFSLEEQLRAAG